MPGRLRIEKLLLEGRGVTVRASTRGRDAGCPACGCRSRRIHGRYTRTLADLPLGGVPVRLRVRVRKFFCDETSCERKIFAERLEGVAGVYARGTDRLFVVAVKSATEHRRAYLPVAMAGYVLDLPGPCAEDLGRLPFEKSKSRVRLSMEDHQDIRIIAVPYDSGHPGLRMGAGPEHLVEHGLCEALRSEGRRPSVATVRHEREPTAEVATAFELHGLVSNRVREAIAGGQFPLVLSGNCNTSAVGAISGADPEGLGVVWLDAHGEFNTPETTTSGFVDGTGLAITVGHCWKRMSMGVPGFSAVPEENVVMVGVRDADPMERARLDASGVTVVGADTIEEQGLGALATALDALRTRVDRVYVHLDLDVLDAGKVGKANEFASEGGPNAEELQAALGVVRARFGVAAAGIASYDPAFDAEGRVLRAAIASARTLTSLIGSPA